MIQPGQVRFPLGRLIVGSVGYAVAAGSMTVLYLGMRAVMDIGGRCVSGGSAYEIAQECPDGVAPLIMLSVFTGLAGLAVGATQLRYLPGPRLWAFGWTALFGSLGWNFLDYGLNPPAEMGVDLEWGWLVCGVMFWLMAFGPLLMLFDRATAHAVLWADAGESTPRRNHVTVRASSIASRNPNARLGGRPAAEVLGVTVTDAAGGTAVRSSGTNTTTTTRPAPDTTRPDGTTAGSLAGDLERLAHLHRSGSLSDDEFRAAKDRLLGGSR